MYFLIASICAMIGIVILVARTKPVYSGTAEHIIDTDRWIEQGKFLIAKLIRKILRFIVVHLVGWYRFVVHDITIHKTLRQKVRELLYEHYNEQRVKRSAGKFPIKRDIE